MVKPSQNITILLEINRGSFTDGFPVTLRILGDGRTFQKDVNYVNLPAIPAEMVDLHQQWQQTSQHNSRILQEVREQVTNVANEDWRQTTQRLEISCRK